MAAAVYGASKGLSVIVLDERAMGGQAGASARIENFLDLPTGISGQALAGRVFVSPLQWSLTRSVLGKASARPELENSQDRKRTKTVQDFLPPKFIIEAHSTGRKSLMQYVELHGTSVSIPPKRGGMTSRFTPEALLALDLSYSSMVGL